jgi:hydrogenase maturation protease
MKNNHRPVLVLGIGNILLHDEGVGVHTIWEMQKMPVPEDVELIDGGTAGADLLDYISDRQKVIVIDAIDCNIAPGTILRFKQQDLVAGNNPAISLHDIGLAETLAMTGHLNCRPKEVVIIGVKPKDLSCGLGLSDEILEIVPKIIEAVRSEIANTAVIPESQFQSQML